jgi:hypothetical protein
MKKYIIERDIPNIGEFDKATLKGASLKSCDALKQLGTSVQWVESYVTGNKTFCVYLAKDESIIKKHAHISGFPANIITEVTTMISPVTAG